MTLETAVVVANGRLRWTPELVDLARNAHALIAADGGANHLARIGLRPQVVVGDLDSIQPATRRWLGEECMLDRPDQDHTDLEKTLDYTLRELGAGSVHVLGALGRRIDHTIGNLGLLTRYHLGPGLVFRDGRELMLAVEGELALPAVAGETWSFWTFDPAVRVSLEGVRWPVEQASLTISQRPSISNQAVADTVRVRSVGGATIVLRQQHGVDADHNQP
jgi:thiamine pyrophosphokinase